MAVIMHIIGTMEVLDLTSDFAQSHHIWTGEYVVSVLYYEGIAKRETWRSGRSFPLTLFTTYVEIISRHTRSEYSRICA